MSVNGVLGEIERSTCLLRAIVDHIISDYADIRIRCLIAAVLRSPASSLFHSRVDAKKWLPEFLCPGVGVHSFNQFLVRQWDRPLWSSAPFSELVTNTGYNSPFLHFDFMVPSSTDGKRTLPFTNFYNHICRPTCPKVLYLPITVLPRVLYENGISSAGDMFDVIVRMSENMSLLWICTGTDIANMLYPINWTTKDISDYWTATLFERLSPNATVIIDIELAGAYHHNYSTRELSDPTTDKRLVIRFSHF